MRSPPETRTDTRPDAIQEDRSRRRAIHVARARAADSGGAADDHGVRCVPSGGPSLPPPALDSGAMSRPADLSSVPEAPAGSIVPVPGEPAAVYHVVSPGETLGATGTRSTLAPDGTEPR
jgi:hypothetical protein